MAQGDARKANRQKMCVMGCVKPGCTSSLNPPCKAQWRECFIRWLSMQQRRAEGDPGLVPPAHYKENKTFQNYGK